MDKGFDELAAIKPDQRSRLFYLSLAVFEIFGAEQWLKRDDKQGKVSERDDEEGRSEWEYLK